MKQVKGTVKLGYNQGKSVKIWYSETMCVWAQGLFAWGAVEQLQFQPTTGWGLVAVLGDNTQGVGDKPDFGYIVYRPTNLLLEFKKDVEVQLLPLPAATMEMWCKNTKPWASCGAYDGTRW